MTEQEIQENMTQIEAIYADFQNRLGQLKKEQDGIISNFLKNLENSKIEEIKKAIANSLNK